MAKEQEAVGVGVPVGEKAGWTKRAAILGSVIIALVLGATGLCVFMKLDEAKAVQTTANAHRICERALEAGDHATCSRLIDQTPSDPWGRKYICEVSDGKHIRITSRGRDGQTGGLGADADVMCESNATGGHGHCTCSIIEK